MNIEDIAEQYPESFKSDVFYKCIIGVTTKGCIAYNANAMIDQMVEKNGMTYEEAIEFFDYKIDGAYVGDYAPLYIWV